MAVGNGTQMKTLFAGVTGETSNIIENCHSKWEEIRENITNPDDAYEFDMLLASCLSRLQAFNEVTHGGGSTTPRRSS